MFSRPCRHARRYHNIATSRLFQLIRPRQRLPQAEHVNLFSRSDSRRSSGARRSARTSRWNDPSVLSGFSAQAQNIGRHILKLLRRKHEQRHGRMNLSSKPDVKSCSGHSRRVGDFFKALRCTEDKIGPGPRAQRDMKCRLQTQICVPAEYLRSDAPELPRPKRERRTRTRMAALQTCLEHPVPIRSAVARTESLGRLPRQCPSRSM